MAQPTFIPQVEIVKVDDLAPYDQNPRIIPDAAVEAVADSIREFGFLQPIVIDDDGSIAAGHTRLQAAKRLGLLEVPIIRAGHLTPDQIRAYRLSDNRTGEYSGWNLSALGQEIVALDEGPLAGFQDDELAVLRAFASSVADDPPLPPPGDIMPAPELVETARRPVPASEPKADGEHTSITVVVKTENADDVRAGILAIGKAKRIRLLMT